MENTVAVFHCKCCPSFKCLTLRLLLQHINAVHSRQINFKVQCGVNGCPSIFTKYNSLYKHTLKHHADVYNGNNTNNNSVLSVNDVNSSDGSCAGEYDIHASDQQNEANDSSSKNSENYASEDLTRDEVTNTIANNDVFEANDSDRRDYNHPEIDSKRAGASFILKIRERNKLTQATVDSIVDGTNLLMEQILISKKREIEKVLEQCTSNCKDEIAKILENTTSPFEGLETRNLQNTYAKENFNHVDYNVIALGRKLITRKKGHKRVLDEKEESFIYIPLLESLRQIFSNKRIRALK
ncbi:uncharacterized protein [Clytia hemisphaerica]|uniref:uncharacterized protein n=1 Tax=Clytia hemisphaerica TaxID=252671 RepID=UPI0034D706B4